MIPQVFYLGPIPINSFGLMVALAIVAAGQVLSRSFARNGIDPSFAERYVVTAGIVGLVGARLWYVATNFAELSDDLVGALLSGGGFTFYGGFLIAFAVTVEMTRHDKIPLHAFLDAVGPALALGYALGRVGCQLSGDGDYGIVATGWWGMSYATGVVPTPPGELRYPTPLYETVLALLSLWALVAIERMPEWQVPYRRFGAYLLLLSVERFLVEFLRPNPTLNFGLSEAQFVAVGLLALGILCFNAGRLRARGST